MQKNKAYLVGPFVGELYWETFRFAPYIIHLKKENPTVKFVVFTRTGRFDLYGKYADIFVPLNLKGKPGQEQKCFGLDGMEPKDYEIISRFFRNKYSERFEIVDCILPDIDGWRYKVKWQFPRNEMDYDFIPRDMNKEVVNDILKINDVDMTHDLIFVDFDYLPETEEIGSYEVIYSDLFKQNVEELVDDINTTYVGCLIEILKGAKFVIGKIDSFSTKLALLLGIPVILKDNISYDSVSLINPLGTTIIKCDDFLEGVDIYENNI